MASRERSDGGVKKRSVVVATCTGRHMWLVSLYELYCFGGRERHEGRSCLSYNRNQRRYTADNTHGT
jgi:hypothetical protein